MRNFKRATLRFAKHSCLFILLFFAFIAKIKAQCMSCNVSYTFDCATSTGLGSAYVISSSGTGPYTYTWMPGAMHTATASNLAPGTYTIYITDASGCMGYTQLIVSNPYTAFNINITSTNVSCYGGNNGQAYGIFNFSNGPPFTYSWAPASFNSSTATATGLTAGIYSLTIKDHKGCGATNTVLITEPTAISSTITNTYVPCFGGTVNAMITSTGGISPYTYSVNGIYAADSTGIATVSAGTKIVSTQDHNGCIITNTVSVTQAPQTIIGFTPTSPGCHGWTDGTVVPSVNGLSPTYSYTWMPGNVTNTTLTNITDGTYTLSVTDASACVTRSVVIVQPPVPLAMSALTLPENCSAMDGAYTLNISGGTGPYTQTILPGNHSGTVATQISSGSYTTIISDARHCIDTVGFTVGNLSTVSLSVLSSTPVLCYQSCNGAVQLLLQNAVSPVTYSATGATTSSTGLISDLCAGFHLFNVIDANGCPATTTINFAAPAQFVYTADATPTVCYGTQVVLHGHVSGEGGNYTYVWSPGNLSGANVSVTPSGTTVYSLNVYDYNHCTLAPVIVTVDVQPQINIGVNAHTGGVCPGSTTQITPTITGGDGNYKYLWQPGNATVSALYVDSIRTPHYSLTVTDGCGSPAAIKVIPVNLFPVVIPIALSSGTNGCSPYSITFVNGTPGAHHATWNFGDGSPEQKGDTAVYNYREAGLYSVGISVIDSNTCHTSCTYTNFIRVQQSPVADFITRPDIVTLNTADNVEFRSSADGNTDCHWYQGKTDLGTAHSIYYSFPDTGFYDFKLVLRGQNNCVDSAIKLIQVIEGFNFYMPNCFTPDGNDLNELLIPKGTGWLGRDYSFEVYDRWGQQVFKSSEPDQGWDGGKKVDKFDPAHVSHDKQEVYTWHVSLTDNQQIRHKLAGQVLLLRKESE